MASYEGYSALSVGLADGVAHVRIANPPVNLFDLALYPEMVRVSDQLRDDADVRAVVLSSSTPGFFIAHFDVSLILTLPTDMGRPPRLSDFDRMCENFRTMPKPTIAAIDGRVGGGRFDYLDRARADDGNAVVLRPWHGHGDWWPDHGQYVLRDRR